LRPEHTALVDKLPVKLNDPHTGRPTFADMGRALALLCYPSNSSTASQGSHAYPHVGATKPCGSKLANFGFLCLAPLARMKRFGIRGSTPLPRHQSSYRAHGRSGANFPPRALVIAVFAHQQASWVPAESV